MFFCFLFVCLFFLGFFRAVKIIYIYMKLIFNNTLLLCPFIVSMLDPCIYITVNLSNQSLRVMPKRSCDHQAIREMSENPRHFMK